MAYLRDRYSRRIAAVKGQTARLRGDVAHVLVEETQNAVDEQLYGRTPLPVTRKMYRSIRPIMQGNNAVMVRFDSSVAPYAVYRLNMHGTSVTGGHVLDMRIGDYLRKNADPRIRRLARMAHRRMLEAK
jgi:hypothetical protein